MDDSETADTVLEAAFTAADDRGTTLVAVRSHRPALALPLGRIPIERVDTAQQDAVERECLAAQLAPWRAKYPAVPVDTLLSHDSPSSTLVGASHSAQLIVIGSHGRGVAAGAVLGSTGLRLLHQAGCPVLVVRRDQAPKG
ncbi:universal stress protein [Actinoplanes sp. NPDC024001]|uniref:universal stress protein n=1 Tax=Actinoplanes sp. NPDC024001 TaxID=3154598 RepID=UPI00340EAEFE